MNEKNAFNLISQFINGWKQNNLQMIVSSLDEHCQVIESHGPTYDGISEIKHWFTSWLEAESLVKKWDIMSYFFQKEKDTAFVEWDFSYLSKGVEHSLPGISVVKFTEQKIALIQEYRMTHKAYAWKGDELKSG